MFFVCDRTGPDRTGLGHTSRTVALTLNVKQPPRGGTSMFFLAGPGRPRKCPSQQQKAAGGRTVENVHRTKVVRSVNPTLALHLALTVPSSGIHPAAWIRAPTHPPLRPAYPSHRCPQAAREVLRQLHKDCDVRGASALCVQKVCYPLYPPSHLQLPLVLLPHITCGC